MGEARVLAVPVKGLIGVGTGLVAAGALAMGIHTTLLVPSILAQADKDARVIAKEIVAAHAVIPVHAGAVTRSELNARFELIMARLRDIQEDIAELKKR